MSQRKPTKSLARCCRTLIFRASLSHSTPTFEELNSSRTTESRYSPAGAKVSRCSRKRWGQSSWWLLDRLKTTNSSTPEAEQA